MKVTVRYLAQLQLAVGQSSETLALPDGASLSALLEYLAQRQPSLRSLLFTSAGTRQPALLIFVGEQQIPLDESPTLFDAAEILFLTPIAGGLSCDHE